jgi:hypothetical protein
LIQLETSCGVAAKLENLIKTKKVVNFCVKLTEVFSVREMLAGDTKYSFIMFYGFNISRKTRAASLANHP